MEAIINYFGYWVNRINFLSSITTCKRRFCTERKVLVEKDVSELADADLSELVTELQSLMTSQEASQKAFVRISQLNLFDMIS